MIPRTSAAREPFDFQRRLADADLSLTHTIIQPTTDKRTDSQILGNKVTVRKVGQTTDGIIVRGARVLATLAPMQTSRRCIRGNLFRLMPRNMQ